MKHSMPFQNSLFIKEGQQLAVAPLVYGAYALCGASGLAGGILALDRLKKHDHNLVVSGVGTIISITGVILHGSVGTYLDEFFLSEKGRLFRALGNIPFIAGTCAYGGAFITYVGSVIHNAFTFTPYSSED